MAIDPRFLRWLRAVGWLAAVATLVAAALPLLDAPVWPVTTQALALIAILVVLRAAGPERALAIGALASAVLTGAALVLGGTGDRVGLIGQLVAPVLLALVALGVLVTSKPEPEPAERVVEADPEPGPTAEIEPARTPVWTREEASGAVWLSAEQAAGGGAASRWGSSSDSGWSRQPESPADDTIEPR